MNPAVAGVPVFDLVIGSTVLLGLGAIASAAARAPVHWQRWGELSAVATSIWLVLAVVPLPRWPGQPFETDARGPGQLVVEAEPGDAAAAAPLTGAEPGPPGAEDLAVPTLERFLIAGYLIGSLAVAGYVLLGLALVRRMVARSAEPEPWLAVLFAARRGAMHAGRARLRVSAARCRPLSTGLLRPTVLIPSVLADPRRETELRRVLDHELVHVRRKDAAGRNIFAIAAPVLWAHPLFWWLRRRALLAAELIADDCAAGAADRRAYARGLVALADEIQAFHPAPGIAPGALRSRTELTRRIHMLIGFDGGLATRCTPKRRVAQAGATLIVVGLCGAVLGARPAPAAEGAPAVEAGTGGGPAVAVESAAPPHVDSVPAPAAAGPDQAPAAPQEPGMRQQLATRQEPSAQQGREQDPGYEATLALVDRALSLRGELEFMEAELGENKRLSQLGTVDESALRRFELNIRSLHRRLQAVEILVRTEIEATQLELAELEQLIERGLLGTSGRVRQVRLNAKLKVLQSAL